MPKKPKIEMLMAGYPPISTRRWQELMVAEVGPAGRGVIRFVLTPIDNRSQAGRRVNHDLPGVLAPGSPLAEFLHSVLGVTITAGQTVDLTTLVGRRITAKFGEPGTDGVQAIAAVKPCIEPAAKPPTVPAATPVTGPIPGKLGGPK